MACEGKVIIIKMGCCINSNANCQEVFFEISCGIEDKEEMSDKIRTQSTSDLFQLNNSASIIVLEVLQNVSVGSGVMSARISLF